MQNTIWNENENPNIISSTRLYFADLFVGAKRMSRKDFWWGILGFSVVMGLAMWLLFLLITRIIPVDDYLTSLFFGLILVAIDGFYLIGLLNAVIRRLHDINFNAWWALLLLIPTIGFIILVVLLCLPQNEKSRYPKLID
ncbi:MULTISPECIES: DUF805 domain-containing protein [Lactobacillaceae]|uniref:DUF805 domain-containing protein n=1 Tax=Lactobacillaceae TaxID=33958 RepID=UPI000C1B7870|nr:MULTISPECIES: DUF805 domain-containing protein [Lactobacillaceae]